MPKCKVVRKPVQSVRILQKHRPLLQLQETVRNATDVVKERDGGILEEETSDQDKKAVKEKHTDQSEHNNEPEVLEDSDNNGQPELDAGYKSNTESELSDYYSDENLDSNNNLIGEEARAYSALQDFMV